MLLKLHVGKLYKDGNIAVVINITILAMKLLITSYTVYQQLDSVEKGTKKVYRSRKIKLKISFVFANPVRFP
jgi:hypothetical protein